MAIMINDLASNSSGNGTGSRWDGIQRPYSTADVERLRSSVTVHHTLAQVGARRLWDLLTTRDYVHALGALTGNQAVQQVRGGLEAIYLSGWQVAADANLSGQTYPDQSLYPANSVPAVVRRLNQALMRADEIEASEGKRGEHYWFAPIVADAEAGFGGPLNAFELMKAMIEAGASGVHFEDQLSSEKKCGHLGGKVLLPTSQFIRTLVAARLAADVLDVPTVLVARTDADSARLLTSDVDERDRPFITGERTPEGFFASRAGSIAPSLARWRTRRSPTCSGARRPRRISMRRANSPTACTRSSRGRCSRTIARRRSTGRRSSTRARSRASSASSAQWGTSSSLSRSPGSTR